MANQSFNDVDLLLVGRTGTGKSATGNAILGRETFYVSDSGHTYTFCVQSAWSRHQGRVLTVVDSPGLFKTDLDRGKAAEKMVCDFTQAIACCPKGFHALILVLKYGNRFTEEEQKAVEMLKDLFGENFVKENCIIVFTHGDIFDINNKMTPNKTFFDWCREQRGPLQTLLEECDYRAVLFNNVDEDHNEAQLQQLLSLVDQMKSNGVCYTKKIFKESERSREKLIVKEKAPQLREMFQAKINLITSCLKQVTASSEGYDHSQETLEQLKGDVRDLEIEVGVQDKGTGVLDPLKQNLADITENISNYTMYRFLVFPFKKVFFRSS